MKQLYTLTIFFKELNTCMAVLGKCKYPNFVICVEFFLYFLIFIVRTKIL